MSPRKNKTEKILILVEVIQDNMKCNGQFVKIMADIVKLIELFTEHLEENMDKEIRSVEKKIKKDTKGEEKSLKKLEKADKKRDKVCALGAKAMMKKKGKK